MTSEHQSKAAKLRGPETPAGRHIPSDVHALLYTAEAAFILGLSPRTLEAMRLKGGGPPYIAVTARAVRYRRGDLDSWIFSRRRFSTSDEGYRSAP